MAYIVLTLTGMIAILVVKKEWPGGKQVLFISAILLVGLLGYLAVACPLPVPTFSFCPEFLEKFLDSVTAHRDIEKIRIVLE